MKEIVFPGLNLIFNINSIAISIREINIYWYAIFIVLAIIITLLFCKKDDGKYNIKFQTIIKISIIVIPISIICARIYYIIFKFEYYQKNLFQIFNIRNGGLAIYGAIIGGLFTIIIYCKKNKINTLDILDYIAPYIPLGQAIGRWGNFFNIEAYGIETTNIFRMGIIEKGKYIEVHPTFLYESICDFFIFIFLYLLRDKRKYKGELSYLYIILYSFIRYIIEGIRADSLMIGEIRVSQIVSIFLFILFSIIAIKQHIKNTSSH